MDSLFFLWNFFLEKNINYFEEKLEEEGDFSYSGFSFFC